MLGSTRNSSLVSVRGPGLNPSGWPLALSSPWRPLSLPGLLGSSLGLSLHFIWSPDHSHHGLWGSEGGAELLGEESLAGCLRVQSGEGAGMGQYLVRASVWALDFSVNSQELFALFSEYSFYSLFFASCSCFIDVPSSLASVNANNLI